VRLGFMNVDFCHTRHAGLRRRLSQASDGKASSEAGWTAAQTVQDYEPGVFSA
jgi:hypothetical protein